MPRGRPTTVGRPHGFAQMTKWDAGHFVAWDGEGACVAKPPCRPGKRCPHPQGYVYLANSEGGELVDEDGIDTRTALAALAGEGKRLGPYATHVCFGLSYDANQMLRDVSRLDLRRLWEGDKVRLFRRFKVAYRARKSLWVKDYRANASVGIWDPFGFFQSSFVKAVEDNLGRNDPRLPLIREGKARRSVFTRKDLPFIRRYTGAELSALVDLCRHLRDAFIAADLKLKRWDGAGAAAAALFERENVKHHLAKCPDEVAKAGRFAYSGGRIETPRYGRFVGKVHHGDIRAAYPWAMTLMPSLAHGRWAHLTERGHVPTEPFSVVRVRWDYARLGNAWDLLPFSFRRSNGSIYFPRRGETWAWRPEVDAALRFPETARRTEILDAWEFRPDDPSDHPFEFNSTIYNARLSMKRAENAAQLALKLGQNSGYGKLAQGVGGTEEKPPPFHQLEYAGFVTSATRARIYLAARLAPTGVITLATDGIYSTEPLTGLVDEEVLGGWELSSHEEMVIAQSGVYWLRNARKGTRLSDGCECRAKKHLHPAGECEGTLEAGPMGTVRCDDERCGWSTLVEHYRGFDPGTLSPDAVLTAWRERRPVVKAASTRFVTLGRATLSETSFRRWRTWATEDRDLDVYATGKRVDRKGPTPHPERGLVATDPADPFERVSTPYVPAFAAERGGDESAAAQEETSLR